jgi:hypothetical protein
MQTTRMRPQRQTVVVSPEESTRIFFVIQTPPVKKAFLEQQNKKSRHESRGKTNGTVSKLPATSWSGLALFSFRSDDGGSESVGRDVNLGRRFQDNEGMTDVC